jgi:phosphotriesterase-related protein
VNRATVNTVLGPVSPDDLGITLTHEHICYGYPGWEGDQTVAPFDRRKIVRTALEMMGQLKTLGVKTLVDATPNDGGRFPEILREVSEKSGVNIICSTGYYYEEEGMPAYWKFRRSLGDVSGEVHELFSKEITEGIRDTGIRAGAIKVGTGKGQITEYERMMFEVAARVQKDTGVPIITHTQEGTLGPEQAALLVSAGADPGRVQIGHMSDNTDIRYQLETLKHGVYVAFDRMGIQVLAGCPMDAERYGVLIGLIGTGHGNRIMISHDYVATWLGRPLNIPEAALPLIGNWHPTHLFKNVIPALKKGGVTDDQIHTILEDNPRRLFGGQ